MSTNLKNISRLNSFAAGILGISGFKSGNIVSDQIDSRTLISIVLLLVVIAVVFIVHNKVKLRNEKLTRSKLSR